MLGLAKKKSLSVVPQLGGGFGGWRIFEAFAGAWQRNIEYKRETVLAYHAIFSCVTLISSDISKMCINMMQMDSDGIWNVSKKPGVAGVLKKPNPYQNRIQFIEQWMISKLVRGNAYILKGRETIGGPVTRLYVLNPDFVLPYVTDSGEVYYSLNQDNLADLQTSIVVPASEIIHDRYNCLYHPLVGVSPIYACGLAAYNGLQIQENSAKFFANGSKPSGIITVPGNLKQEQADELKATWSTNFQGENVGKTAVLADGMKYEPLSITPEEAAMVDQLKLTSEIVCSTFHVPSYKVIGDPPSFNNIEALEQQYYSQALQRHIEDIELLLDEGLYAPDNTGMEFDLSGLLRMDTQSQITSLKDGVGGGIFAPNEARKRMNLPKIKGGDTVYMQQQSFSLEALAKRDAKDDPFASNRFTAPASMAELEADTPAGKSGTPVAAQIDAPTPADTQAQAKAAFLADFSKALGIMQPTMSEA